MKTPRAKKTGKALDEWLTWVREQFTLIEEAEAQIRSDALEDWAFRAGDHYPEELKRARESDSRPCYVINRVQQIVRNLTNEERQQRPAIEVSPIGSGADVETAEVLQGVARHTELVSDADIAYDCGFDAMATGGFGYIRVMPEYISPKSFDQEPRFQRVLNPFSVYCGPAKEPDYSDMRICLITEGIPRDRYEELYPDSEVAGLTEFEGAGDRAPGWMTADEIRVAEVFWIESEKKTIVKGTDGKSYYEDELPKGVKAARNKKTGEIYTRETEFDTVYWCKTNGIEILEDELEVACDRIPVVPVLGEEFIVNGRRYLIGAVRYTRTPNLMYDLWVSAMAESIALAPKVPWMATPAQLEGFEHYWQTANTTNWPYLPYNPDPKASGPPSRQAIEPPIQAITEALAHADADLKNVSSFDPSLAQHGPVQPAKALLLRKENSDQANFGFQDNMSRSIRACGRIVVSMWQRLADVPRTVRIMNPDGTKDLVQLGMPTLYKGAQKIFDLTVGEFDVAVSTGPSYASRRKEASESILGLVQSFPQLMQVAGDLLVGSMDWPQSQEIAARLKLMLPAQLQQDENGGPPPVPPAAQQQMAEQGKMVQALTASVHQLSAKLEAQAVQAASKERIAALNAEAMLTAAALKAKTADSQFVFDKETEHIDRMLGVAQPIIDPAQGLEAGPPQAGDPAQAQPAAPQPPPSPAPPQAAPAQPLAG